MSANNFLLLLFTITLTGLVKAHDPLEGVSPGAYCFQKRPITGCEGTLLQNFTPEAKGVGINEQDTLMFLFTSRNPFYPEYLHECGARLPANTNFDPALKTEVFVHGWLDGTCRTAWMREMRNELFARGDYNVILIDWTWGNGLDYINTGTNSFVVGEQLGYLLNNIINQTGIDPRSIHIIGHSYGSHIAGFAGQKVKNLGRITGLDPAMAPFQNAPLNERLDPGDANLVDNIHSGMGHCPIIQNIGDFRPLGHADFYPNGGATQLSCIPLILQAYLKVDFLYATVSVLPVFCNHLQSTQYYKMSINQCGCQYVGVQCNDYLEFQTGSCRSCGSDGRRCAVMGMDFEIYPYTKNDQDHKYYLDTTLYCPYCDNSKINLEGYRFGSRNGTSACNRSYGLKEVLDDPIGVVVGNTPSTGAGNLL